MAAPHKYLIFSGTTVTHAKYPKRGPLEMSEAVKGRWANGDRVSGSDVYDIAVKRNPTKATDPRSYGPK